MYKKLTAVPIFRDRNCLFRCLSYFIFSTQDRHYIIRLIIVKYVRDHWDSFKELVCKEGIYDKKIFSKEAYYEHLTNQRVYGGDVEITAFSQIFPNVKIIIQQGDINRQRKTMYGDIMSNFELILKRGDVINSAHFYILHIHNENYRIGNIDDLKSSALEAKKLFDMGKRRKYRREYMKRYRSRLNEQFRLGLGTSEQSNDEQEQEDIQYLTVNNENIGICKDFVEYEENISYFESIRLDKKRKYKREYMQKYRKNLNQKEQDIPNINTNKNKLATTEIQPITKQSSDVNTDKQRICVNSINIEEDTELNDNLNGHVESNKTFQFHKRTVVVDINDVIFKTASIKKRKQYMKEYMRRKRAEDKLQKQLEIQKLYDSYDCSSDNCGDNFDINETNESLNQIHSDDFNQSDDSDNEILNYEDLHSESEEMNLKPGGHSSNIEEVDTSDDEEEIKWVEMDEEDENEILAGTNNEQSDKNDHKCGPNDLTEGPFGYICSVCDKLFFEDDLKKLTMTGSSVESIKTIIRNNDIRKTYVVPRGRPRKRKNFNFMQSGEEEQPVHPKGKNKAIEKNYAVAKNKQKSSFSGESPAEGSETSQNKGNLKLANVDSVQKKLTKVAIRSSHINNSVSKIPKVGEKKITDNSIDTVLPVPINSNINVERDATPQVKDKQLAPPTLHTDIKEEPTYLIDPLREEFLNVEREIILKEEPENDIDVDVELEVKEEVEEEGISEQEKLRRHKLFIVSQPAPVIEKEAIPDPLQEINPAVAGSSSFKPSISVRDIRTLTHNVPTPLTQTLKLRKVSRAEVLRAMKNNKPLVRVSNKEATQTPVKKVQVKPTEKIVKPRIYRDILSKYLLKSKLPALQSNNDSGNDLINQMRKRIRVISVNLNNQKNLSA